MERDAIDLSTLNVFTLFRKYFVPTLLGMLGMSAVTAPTEFLSDMGWVVTVLRPLISVFLC